MAGNGSTRTKTTNSVPNFVLLSSPFAQTPFIRPVKPNVPLPTTGSSNGIHELHRSLVLNVEKFFSFIRSFVAHNPLIQKAVSLSSEFRALCQEVHLESSMRVRFPLSGHGFAAVLLGDSVAGTVVANGLLNFFNIYNTLLVVRLVLTWFPNAPPAIVSPLSTICDPYLNIFRGVIPPLGGTLDLSPILAFLVLNAFTSTAAALPCELPPADGSPSSSSFSETKWMRRRRLSSKNQTKVSNALN